MAMCRRVYFSGSSKILRFTFSTSSTVNNKWRREQGLEPNPRQFGPLTILPDYSFVDGRPPILSSRKIMKIKYQQDLCKRIVKLTHELDVGLEMYNEKMKQNQLQRETILKNKLKPKGAALLSKSPQKEKI